MSIRKAGQDFAEPPSGRQRRDVRQIESGIKFGQVNSDNARRRGKPTRRVEKVLRRQSSRPRARRARTLAAIKDIDIEVNINALAMGQGVQRLIKGRLNAGAFCLGNGAHQNALTAREFEGAARIGKRGQANLRDILSRQAIFDQRTDGISIGQTAIRSCNSR